MHDKKFLFRYFNVKNIIICLFLLIITGCQTTQELDIWPLIYYEKNKEETQLDLLTSIYSYNDNPKQTTHSFRPFFVGEFPKEKELMNLLFLWPFGYYRQRPDDKKIWLLPFYYYRDRKDPDFGERDFDWFFLPFMAFGGTDTNEGKYLYMTVWGNLKGILGYDEITLTPFPFYVKAKDGDYVTRGYLWPFFRFGDGGGKRFRFYCMLYSEYDKEGKFKRRSYLWPFIHYNKEDLHKKHPRTEFMFFPFYGQSKSDVSVSRSFLWPFFSYAYNNKSGYREYNCPWPFFKYHKSENLDEFRLWPFYWNMDKKITPEGKENDLILMWPFYWHTQGDYLTYKKESRYVLPFYWSHWKKAKHKDAKAANRLKIWPLLSYNQKEDGTVRYQSLSPLWFEDYLPNGFKKAWEPLFTLFDYSKGPKGKKTFSMLGPVYQYKRNQDSLYHRVLFFSYKDSSKEKEGRFSVLGGLFKYSWNKESKGISLFYLPELISW